MSQVNAPANSFQPATRAEWGRWLAKNHAVSKGVWLITFKKAVGKERVGYEEAVEEALSFGWIDSKPAKLDAERTMLWFSPRKPKSGWSGPNKKRIERLMVLNKMHPAGRAIVEAAIRDGSWSKLDTVEKLEIPIDLAQSFKRFAGSAKNFAAFPPSTRRGILEWILQAKKPETRAKRIDETARLAAENIRANQWRP